MELKKKVFLLLVLSACVPVNRGRFYDSRNQHQKTKFLPLNQFSTVSYGGAGQSQYLGAQRPAHQAADVQNAREAYLQQNSPRNCPPARRNIAAFDACTSEAIRRGAMRGLEPFPPELINAQFTFPKRSFNGSVTQVKKSAVDMARDGDPFLLSSPRVKLPRGVSVSFQLPRDRCQPGRVSFGPMPPSAGGHAGKFVQCTALGRGRTNWPYADDKHNYDRELNSSSRKNGRTLNGTPCSYVHSGVSKGATPVGDYTISQIRKGAKESSSWGGLPSIQLNPDPSSVRGAFFVHSRHEHFNPNLESSMDAMYMSSFGCPRLNPSCQNLLNIYLKDKRGSKMRVSEI